MTQPAAASRYALITPARNEESFIAQTIESMIAQTLRPVRWIIVNDGSTDRTRDLAQEYAERYDFLRVIDVARDGTRSFARKAIAFREGLCALRDVEYAFIGNLDADISLPSNYYAEILAKFEQDPELGIAGGIVYTKVGNRYLTADETTDSVGGAVQLFRAQCFQAVGGYLPLQHGGIDAAAEITARMLGWKVRKFHELRVTEQRRTGSAEATPLRARVREGRRFHSLGYGLAFFIARSVYRLKDPPVLLGALASAYGYLRSYLSREPVLLPADVVAYLRREQNDRLKRLYRKVLPLQR